MKLCSSLIISAMFHAVVLFLPLSGSEPRTQELIPVIVLGVAEGDGSAGLATGRRGEGGGGGAKPQGDGAPERRAVTHSTIAQGHGEEDRTVKKAPAKSEAVAPGGGGLDAIASDAPIAAATAPVETRAEPEPAMDAGIAVASVSGNGAGESQTVSASTGGQAAGTEVSTGGAGTGGSGSGLGVGGSGNGLGLTGDGNGGGGLGAKPAYAGVSYAHTPKPAYPEEARKAGWQGTVMLAVLVNVGGKAEKIEIKGSSGYAPLDEAAVEGLKRWLFRPARYGERAVESWVKIPVVFRLAETKD